MKEYAVYKNGTFQGSTKAVSEGQAINNVRHRKFGEYESQYQNTWEAVCIDNIEAEKAKLTHKEAKQKAIDFAHKTWPSIPEGSSVISYHPPCEFWPTIEGEPDLISRGELDGIKVDLGFFRGDPEPKLYRRLVDSPIEDPQEQLDIFSL